MSDIYESITIDLDKITDEYMRRIAAATDELMDEKLASIGYVKVVRCRDCKHYTPQGAITFLDYSRNEAFCEYIRGYMLQIWPDGFCAWGERK